MSVRLMRQGDEDRGGGSHLHCGDPSDKWVGNKNKRRMTPVISSLCGHDSSASVGIAHCRPEVTLAANRAANFSYDAQDVPTKQELHFIPLKDYEGPLDLDHPCMARRAKRWRKKNNKFSSLTSAELTDPTLSPRSSGVT